MSSKTKYSVGFFEILTIAFVVLKLTGFVDFTWWQAFSPAIIAFSAGLIEGIIEAIVEDNEKGNNK